MVIRLQSINLCDLEFGMTISISDFNPVESDTGIVVQISAFVILPLGLPAFFGPFSSKLRDSARVFFLELDVLYCLPIGRHKHNIMVLQSVTTKISSRLLIGLDWMRSDIF